MFKKIVLLKRRQLGHDLQDGIPIQAVFESISGEGPTAGLPTVFIRVAGCSRTCKWCDTGYTEFAEARKAGIKSLRYTPHQLADLVEKEFDLENRHICITGGEPFLYHKSIKEFMELVTPRLNYSVETNGELLDRPDAAIYQGLFVSYVISYKLSSSGRMYQGVIPNWLTEMRNIYLKFVIANRQDLQDMFQLLGNKWFVTPIYLQPVWQNNESMETVLGFLSENSETGAARFKQKCSASEAPGVTPAPLAGVLPDYAGIISEAVQSVCRSSAGLNQHVDKRGLLHGASNPRSKTTLTSQGWVCRNTSSNEFRLSLQLHKILGLD